MNADFFRHLKKYPAAPTLILFILISAVHLFFKSLFLDHSGFWYDETFGLFYSQQDWGLIKHTSEWDLNPPMYYYFLHIWQNLFGISEYAIRFSSVLFSSLSAGMLFIFAARHFNQVTAWVALLLFTASHEIFFYAHEARCYSLVLFLALSSSYIFFELMKRKSLALSVLLGVVNFLLIYAHYLTGLLLLTQLAITVFVNKKDFYRRATIAFGTLALLACWRFTKKTLLLIFNHEKSFWLEAPTFADLKNAFFDFFNGKTIFIFYLILIAATLIYFAISKKHRSFLLNNKFSLAYLFLCGIGSILVCFAVSFGMPVFLKRYLLFATPFIYILIAFLVSGLPLLFRNISLGLVALASFWAFSLIDLRTPKHMDYREAMLFIKNIKSDDTAVLVETRDMAALFAYYYDRKIFTDHINLHRRLNENTIFPVSTAADLRQVDITKFNRVILTQTFDYMNPGSKELQTAISARFPKQLVIAQYEGVNIRVFYQ